MSKWSELHENINALVKAKRITRGEAADLHELITNQQRTAEWRAALNDVGAAHFGKDRWKQINDAAGEAQRDTN